MTDYVTPEEYKARWDEAEADTDHELVEDHGQCRTSGFWPECQEPESQDACPRCGAPLREKWSGVECTACDYWFCY